MIKAAIIDDEINGRDIIKQYISLYCEGIEVCGEADSVKSGLNLLTNVDADLVFLDIQMQDGTGFNLLEQLPSRTFKVIFVTSFDQFALKAFKYSVSDYLLKPIAPDAFAESVAKVQSDIEANKNKPHADVRIEELLANVNTFEKIGLPTNNGIRFVKVDDIVRCEAEGSYTIFHFVDKSNYVVTKNLKFYDDLLTERKFLRVHKSHLINLRFIEQYINGDGGQVMMADGSMIEISRRKKDELLNLIMGG